MTNRTEDMRKLLNEFKQGLNEGAHDFKSTRDGDRNKIQADWDEAYAEAKRNTELAKKSSRYDPYADSDIDELKGLIINDDRVFEDYREARQYINDNTEKYEYAMAVPLNNEKTKWLVGGWLSE